MYLELVHMSQTIAVCAKEINIIWFLPSNFCFIEYLVHPFYQGVTSGVRPQYSGSEPYGGIISKRLI